MSAEAQARQDRPVIRIEAGRQPAAVEPGLDEHT